MTEATDAAQQFERLFRESYLRFHRRDGKRTELSNASRAVLTHLSMAGPVTIGEAALHLDRAQSVVSDIVTGLEGHGLVQRRTDPDDRRRTLVWLTPAGSERLRRDAMVLDEPLLATAFDRLDTDAVTALLDSLAALNAAAPAAGRDARVPDQTHAPVPAGQPDRTRGADLTRQPDPRRRADVTRQPDPTHRSVPPDQALHTEPTGPTEATEPTEPTESKEPTQ